MFSLTCLTTVAIIVTFDEALCSALPQVSCTLTGPAAWETGYDLSTGTSGSLSVNNSFEFPAYVAVPFYVDSTTVVVCYIQAGRTGSVFI
jgi:hypothetical protein